MIFDDPIDPDTEVPRKIVPREEALSILEGLVSEGQVAQRAAQHVWTAFLAPLYDARALGERWSRGRCPCGAVHPAWQTRNPGLRSEASRGHRMWCRWYVGPLEHRERSERYGIVSDEPITECTCGRSYRKWADEDWTKRNVCPDILYVWRGDREVNDMGGKDDKPILEPRPDDPNPEPENV